MTATRLQRITYGFIAAATLIALADVTALRLLSLSLEEPALVYAVMLDLMLVLPALYWFMVLRPRGKSIGGIMAFPLLGAAAAWLLTPMSQRELVWGASWPVKLAVLAAEIAFIAYGARRIYGLAKDYRTAARTEADTMEAWRSAIHSRFAGSKLAPLLLHESSMIYYLLLSWRQKKPAARNEAERTFTYHKKTNQTLYSAILTKIILIEGVCVHLLVSQWSHWAAWLLTIADVWLLALIWSDCRASALQPVKLKEDSLRLRYGLRIQGDIPLASIAAVSSSREFQLDPKEMKHAAGPIFGAPNVKIELKERMKVEGLLFQSTQVDTIYLLLDEPEAFVQELGLGESSPGVRPSREDE
jgi:hypothetical protein